ncbi:hypothetical protein D9M68_838160 [compost metagenome]
MGARDKRGPNRILLGPLEEDPEAHSETLPGLFQHVVDRQDIARELVALKLRHGTPCFVQRLEVQVETAAGDACLFHHVLDHRLLMAGRGDNLDGGV